MSKTIQQFVEEHRVELVEHVLGICNNCDVSDEQLADWVINDETLCNWARLDGVDVCQD